MGVTTQDLELYLPFYSTDLQGSPITSKDFSAHSCTVTGATWGNQGRTFDGADDKIAIPNVASLRPTTALTVVAWVYPTALASERLILGHINDSGVNRRSWMLLIDSSQKFKFYCSSDGTHGNSDSQASATTATVDTLYHVAVTYSPTALTIYINGVADGNKNPSVNSLYENTTDDLYVGVDANSGRDFAGRIGEVLLYSRTLTDTEILNHYQNTKRVYLTCWDYFTWG